MADPKIGWNFSRSDRSAGSASAVTTPTPCIGSARSLERRLRCGIA
jgi:hypothetical protein